MADVHCSTRRIVAYVCECEMLMFCYFREVFLLNLNRDGDSFQFVHLSTNALLINDEKKVIVLLL